MQDRGFFNTVDSTAMRAANPKALVGKTIETNAGQKGVVRHVISKLGGSTLHTAEFGNGKVEKLHLAKEFGGKGAAFHLSNSHEREGPG
jgi:hypothetical protein